jgi:hypothetical protein
VRESSVPLGVGQAITIPTKPKPTPPIRPGLLTTRQLHTANSLNILNILIEAAKPAPGITMGAGFLRLGLPSDLSPFFAKNSVFSGVLVVFRAIRIVDE